MLYKEMSLTQVFEVMFDSVAMIDGMKIFGNEIYKFRNRHTDKTDTIICQ